MWNNLKFHAKIQRGHWPSWNLNDPAEISNRRFEPITFFKREYPAKLYHREISPYHILNLNKKGGEIRHFIFGFSALNDPAETDFDDFRSDYLGEYDDICETALARESGTLGGVDWWKNRWSKSRETVPLN
jgi:hypothetical protein